MLHDTVFVGKLVKTYRILTLMVCIVEMLFIFVFGISYLVFFRYWGLVAPGYFSGSCKCCDSACNSSSGGVCCVYVITEVL